MKKAVLSRRAPKPIGPYSQGVDCGKMVFVSGQIPADAAGNLTGPAVSEQTERCLDNVEAVLKAAGLGLKDVVKTTVFMTDLACFAEMNEAYAKRFKPPYPARAAVQVSALPKGAAVE
ncbi:MAG: Rid family detoxifying hydrolase, partial [Elusimicrobia bacterium]|nr:Rid family detoxifying hydrolase [Elusimicrobiota bacterium]